MKKVEFLFGCSIFKEDGSRNEIDAGEIFDVQADYTKGGYRYMDCIVNEVSESFIYDPEDMKVVIC